MRAAQKLRSRRRGLERRPHRRAQRVDLRSDRLLPEAHRLSGDPQALLGFLEDAVASERISPADLLMMERLIGDSQLGRALDPSFEARAAEITGAEPGSARLVEGLPNFVRAEGARALAAGSTIAVAPGQARNEALLAHELTHVSQHSAGGPQLHFDSGAGGAARAEVEANRAGEKVERQQGVQAKPEKQQIDPKTRAQLERLSRVSSAEVAAMRRDVEKIAGVLMEWHISDAEEQKMLAPFHRWLVRDNKRNAQLRELADKGIHPERRVSRTMYLDRLVLQCRMKTLNKGSARTMGMKFARSVFDDLFFELTEQNLLSYKNYLRLSETGRRDVERPPKPPPNIWKEVVGKTVNDLPAGITSATGGALQSLPFGVGDSAGEFLKERADDYMASGGIAALAGAEGMESSEELREEVIAGTSLVGRVGGEVGQVVAGGAILKAATAPGKVAKAADTLNKANKARRATQAAKVVQTADKANKAVEVGQFITNVYRSIDRSSMVFGIAWKAVNDITVECAAGHSAPTLMRSIDIILSRTVKELGTDYAKSWSNEKEDWKKHEAAGAEANRLDARADRREANLANRPKRKRKGGQKRADQMREEAGVQRKLSGKALTAYLAKVAVRRVIVALLHQLYRFTVEFIRERFKGRVDRVTAADGEAFLEELKAQAPERLIAVALTSGRDVMSDLLKSQGGMPNHLTEQIVDAVSKYIQRIVFNEFASHI